MATVALENINKVYENGFQAIHDLNLDIAESEFLVLVGPSGCGKSTALRMIAGLETISSGKLSIGDRVVNDVEPKDRDIAMVFQNYALYPHMTVFDNIGFALKLAKVPKKEIDERVRKAAAILELESNLDRKPGQLSGGQRQRVAMGRAIVRQPAAFLMDEPLSNLDAKLRVQMRAELKRFHQDLSATVIYVTHDQLEAMTMADKMAVMSGGILQQYDSPERVFEAPVNTFVAGFVGSPAMNLLRAKVVTEDTGAALQGDGWHYPLSPANARRALRSSTDEVVVGVRHSTAEVHAEARPGSIAGRIYTVEPTGDITYAHVYIGSTIVVVSVPAGTRFAADDQVWVDLDQARLHLFDGRTEQALRPDS
jgi:multiple sugar transport system ATP-binding protein